MKVLLLTTSFPLTKESRSGVFVLRLVESLPNDVRVTVLTPDDFGTEKYATSSCYELRPFRYAPKSWQRLAHGEGGITAALAQSKLNLLLLPALLCSCFIATCWLARKTDIIHANWSINGVIAGIAGLLLRKPVITTLRGSDVNMMAKSGLMHLLVRCCFVMSRQVVTVSPSLQQTLATRFPAFADKISVIANGIAPAFFTAGERRDCTAAPLRFLYAGNLIPGKGVQVILEAAASLAEDNWFLDIVGDGPERKKLEAFCQAKSLSGKVRFHGAVAPEEMPDWMGQADVFVFASFAEGRPNVLLEAMAAGLPVIASSIPAVQDLITPGKEGLLFPPGDARQLALQMTQLLSRTAERRGMGEQARRTVAALGLSWEETGRRYAALYKAALNLANPPPCPAPWR
ncbi:MAG: glycosyltransferase [Candidatus Electronema sp. V4]|uniref:glycosyltransferase n=1 Tax=Candidatus Electronema sp. V4 TaxID=3454756 RepID=UPI0040554109